MTTDLFDLDCIFPAYLNQHGFRPQLGALLNLPGVSRACSALLFGVTLSSFAQQAGPPALPPMIDFPATPAEDRMPDPTQGIIRVDFTVTDQAGKPVTGLSQKDFRLLDNDQERKLVTFQAFDQSTAQAVGSHEVVLVIDELNMVPKIKEGYGLTANDPLHAARAREERAFAAAVREVETFLRSGGGVLQEPTIIYRLTADGLFATPHASMDGNELANQIEQPAKQNRIWPAAAITKDVEHITNGGNVSARITQSLIALGSIAIEERRNPGRKILFWIGNGWQIENRKSTGLADFSVELLTRMREARISLWGASEWPLYDSGGNAVSGSRLNGEQTPVGDYWPVQELVFKEFLKGPKPDSTDLRYLSLPVIAARSGGGVLDVRRNLAEKMRDHVTDEASYYSLTFDPPRTSSVDEYHHLKVEIGKPDLTAQLFEDYYDQPVFYDQPPETQPVSVRQLEELIANAHDTSGSELARQLDSMQLTERLSSEKLEVLEKSVHGKKAREAFEILADESVFLPPPADEILSTPAPDMAAQRQMILSTASYIKNTIPHLPDVFATRTTVQYHELPPKPNETWKTALPVQSLHEGETATASVHVHDGRERVEDVSVKNASDKLGVEQLRTIGTFGPILATVLAAATSPHSELVWSRWEKSPDGALAVFRYRVTQETPYFTAEFCCLPYDFDTVPFRKPAPFHGEIAVDPSTGAIMRLTIQADLPWRLPLEHSDVMVEYRPVQKGARAFICPSRSVSVSRQRRTSQIHEWGEDFKVYAPFETLLNEMRFEKYHIFGSTSRILPGYTEVPDNK